MALHYTADWRSFATIVECLVAHNEQDEHEKIEHLRLAKDCEQRQATRQMQIQDETKKYYEKQQQPRHTIAQELVSAPASSDTSIFNGAMTMTPTTPSLVKSASSLKNHPPTPAPGTNPRVRNPFPPISDRLPNVVRLKDGKTYVELRCNYPGCGANWSVQNGSFFKGVAGFHSHYCRSHPDGAWRSAKFDDTVKMFTYNILSQEEVNAILTKGPEAYQVEQVVYEDTKDTTPKEQQPLAAVEGTSPDNSVDGSRKGSNALHNSQTISLHGSWVAGEHDGDDEPLLARVRSGQGSLRRGVKRKLESDDD